MQSPSAENDKRISGSQLRAWEPLLAAWDSIHGRNSEYTLGDKMDYSPLSQALVHIGNRNHDKDRDLVENYRKFGMEAEIRPIMGTSSQNRYIVTAIDPEKMRLPEMNAQETSGCAERFRKAARKLRLAHALISQPIAPEHISLAAQHGFLKHAGEHKHRMRNMKEYWKEEDGLRTLSMFDAMRLHDWNNSGSKDVLIYIANSKDLTMQAQLLDQLADFMTQAPGCASGKALAGEHKFLAGNTTMLAFINYFLTHNGLGGSVPAIAAQTQSLLSEVREALDKASIEAVGNMLLNDMREEIIKAAAVPEPCVVTAPFKPVPVRRDDTAYDYAIGAELPSLQEAQEFGAMLEKCTPYQFKTLPSATGSGTICTLCNHEKRTVRFGDMDGVARVLKQMHQTFDMPVAGLEYAKKSVGSQHK